MTCHLQMTTEVTHKQDTHLLVSDTVSINLQVNTLRPLSPRIQLLASESTVLATSSWATFFRSSLFQGRVEVLTKIQPHCCPRARCEHLCVCRKTANRRVAMRSIHCAAEWLPRGSRQCTWYITWWGSKQKLYHHCTNSCATWIARNCRSNQMIRLSMQCLPGF